MYTANGLDVTGKIVCTPVPVAFVASEPPPKALSFSDV
jgi:hypothetical protein